MFGTWVFSYEVDSKCMKFYCTYFYEEIEIFIQHQISPFVCRWFDDKFVNEKMNLYRICLGSTLSVSSFAVGLIQSSFPLKMKIDKLKDERLFLIEYVYLPWQVPPSQVVIVHIKQSRFSYLSQLPINRLTCDLKKFCLHNFPVLIENRKYSCQVYKWMCNRTFTYELDVSGKKFFIHNDLQYYREWILVNNKTETFGMEPRRVSVTCDKPYFSSTIRGRTHFSVLLSAELWKRYLIPHSSFYVSLHRRSHLHLIELSIQVFYEVFFLVKPAKSLKLLWGRVENHVCFYPTKLYFSLLSIDYLWDAFSNLAILFRRRFRESGFPTGKEIINKWRSQK